MFAKCEQLCLLPAVKALHSRICSVITVCAIGNAFPFTVFPIWAIVCGWQVSLFAEESSLCRILIQKQSNKNKKNLPSLEETVLHDNNGTRIPKSNMSHSMLNNYLNYSVFSIRFSNLGDE